MNETIRQGAAAAFLWPTRGPIVARGYCHEVPTLRSATLGLWPCQSYARAQRRKCSMNAAAQKDAQIEATLRLALEGRSDDCLSDSNVHLPC